MFLFMFWVFVQSCVEGVGSVKGVGLRVYVQGRGFMTTTTTMMIMMWRRLAFGMGVGEA